MHHFTYNTNSCFHLLLHLEKPSDIFLDLLLNSGYNEIQIRQQLSIPGSRFFPEFVSDIDSLLVRLNQYSITITPEENDNLRITAVVDLECFPRGIGTNAVISMHELSDIQKSKLFLQKNRKYNIQHLAVKSFPTTSNFMVIVKPLKKGHQFITAFPGDESMPMPHHGMKLDLYEACKKFWDTHVILVQE